MVIEDRETRRLDSLRRSGLLSTRRFDHIDRLTQVASRLIGAPVALVSMVDDGRQYFTSQVGLPPMVARDRETGLLQSVCKSVVAGEQPLVIESMAADGNFVDHPARDALSVESYCGVPITDQHGFVLGSFCVIDDHAHEWRVQDIELLESFAAIVGDYIQTNHDHQALISDLQQRLLPDELPDVTSGVLAGTYRSVPTTDAVGGDFFDWQRRADGAIDLVMGDVVGHGIGSTQAAAQLRAASRAVLMRSASTPDISVTRIAEVCADLPGCACAALIVARIAPDGADVTWVRAGAMPPIRTGDAGVLLTGVPGAPISAGSYSADHLNHTHLAPGETLFMFTDGLVERRGEAIDVGLARATAAAGDFSTLDAFVDEVCPPPTQQDDVAVVSFTRR